MQLGEVRREGPVVELAAVEPGVEPLFGLTEASTRRRAVGDDRPIAASAASVLTGESFMLTVMHVRLSALAPARATQSWTAWSGGPAGGEFDGESHAAAVRSSAALAGGSWSSATTAPS